MKSGAHEVVGQDLEVWSSGVSSDVSVARGVLDGAVVRLFRVRLELEVAVGLHELCGQAEVDDVHVVLLAFAETQEQVLSLDVVVDVALDDNKKLSKLNLYKWAALKVYQSLRGFNIWAF